MNHDATSFCQKYLMSNMISINLISKGGLGEERLYHSVQYSTNQTFTHDHQVR